MYDLFVVPILVIVLLTGVVTFVVRDQRNLTNARTAVLFLKTLAVILAGASLLFLVFLANLGPK